MAPIALRPVSLLALSTALAASTGCSLVSSTDCTERPLICPVGAACVDGECVASPDADIDSPCDVFTGEGCSEGDICTYSATVGAQDSIVLGCLRAPDPARAPGEICSFYASGDVWRSDCRGGTACLPRNAEATQIECMTLCRSTQPEMCEGAYGVDGLCIMSLSDEDSELRACYRPDGCDPRCRNACEAELACVLFDDSENHGYACAAPGLVAEGQSCTYTYQCQGGLYCHSSRCTSYCTLPGNPRPLCTGFIECDPVRQQCVSPGSYADMFDAIGIGVCQPR